jgi:large subunit ribosomal protein L21
MLGGRVGAVKVSPDGSCVALAPCVQSRTLNFPLGISLPYAIARVSFRPQAAMPADTYTYKALGEQD